MPDNNDLLSRRRDAELAMGGEKLVEKEKLEDKRRREAILAMEGEQHRARREAREAAESNLALRLKQEAELRAKAEAETKAKIAREAAEKAQKETDTLNAEIERKDKIVKANTLTDQLKNLAPKLSSLRTIKTDMARAVKEEGLSLSKIATLSQERSGGADSIISEERSSLGLILSVVIVLVGSAGLATWWWLSQPTQTNTANVLPPPPSSSILQADVARPVDLSNLNTVSRVRTAYEAAAEQKTERGGLVNLHFIINNEHLPLVNFRQAFGLNLPADLVRHVRDNFFLGVYDNQEIRSRFLILQTSFFDQTYSAMLDWERYMASDLGTLLKTSNNNKSSWSDSVIHNKDVRIQKTEGGDTILIYGFIDKQTLLITRDEQTFIKVFDRLINQN